MAKLRAKRDRQLTFEIATDRGRLDLLKEELERRAALVKEVSR